MITFLNFINEVGYYTNDSEFPENPKRNFHIRKTTFPSPQERGLNPISTDTPIKPSSSQGFNVRWMIRRDFSDIEKFTKKPDLNKMVSILAQMNKIGMVVENKSGQVIGYMIYTLTSNSDLEIRDLFNKGIWPIILNDIEVSGNRKQNFELLIRKLIEKVKEGKRNAVVMNYAESMLAFPELGKWLNDLGFKGRLVKNSDGTQTIQWIYVRPDIEMIDIFNKMR